MNRSSVATQHPTDSGTMRPSNRLLILFAALLLCGVGGVLAFASYFYLSSDVRALRDSTFSALKAEPSKTLDLNIGWFTTSFIRTGAGFFQMPPEARAVLHSVRAVEAGHYTLSSSTPIHPGHILSAGDEAMLHRGWTRAVTVIEGDNLVATYVSDRAAAHGKIRCCVLVLSERNLVVGSANTDPAPLISLAASRVRADTSATFLLGRH